MPRYSLLATIGATSQVRGTDLRVLSARLFLDLLLSRLPVWVVSSALTGTRQGIYFNILDLKAMYNVLLSLYSFHLALFYLHC